MLVVLPKTYEKLQSISRSVAKRPLIGLILIWLATVIVIFPVGEFSVNDDWGFSTPVRWWSEDGFLQFTFHMAMTLIAQVALGFAWSEIFGFSQFGLRILVALLAVAFLAFAFFTIRECGQSQNTAFFGPLLFLAFPLFVFCSVTFLTETPFQAFGAGALYFFTVTIFRGAKSRPSYFAGMAFLMLAILTRQVALFIAIGFLVGDLWANGLRLRIVSRALAPVIVSVAIVLSYPGAVEPIGGVSAPYQDRTHEAMVIVRDLLRLKLGALAPLISASYWGALYFGLLMAPLAGAVAIARLNMITESRVTLAVAGVVTAVLLLVAIVFQRPLPVTGDTLSPDGLGARFVQPYFPEQPVGLGWWIITVLAATSFGVLAGEIARAALRLRSGESTLTRREVGVMLLLFTAGGLSFASYGLHYGAWYGRYILFSAFCAVVFCLMFCIEWDAIILRKRRIVSVLAGVGVISSALLSHDFFEWSRTRYALIDEALNAGVKPEALDGGFEYNNLRALLENPSASMTKKLEPERGYSFMLAKAPLDGYHVLSRKKVRRILPLGGDEIYLLRKNAEHGSGGG